MSEHVHDSDFHETGWCSGCDEKRTPEGYPDGDGDCFVVAAETVAYRPGDLLLVHGTVVGSGVPRHPHAWVEFRQHGVWMVVDDSNGHHWVGERDTYYRIGQVEDVRRYNRRAAFGKLEGTRHYGPWE